MPKNARRTLGETTFPAVDSLDVEIDAAVRQRRKIDIANLNAPRPETPQGHTGVHSNPTAEDIKEWTLDTNYTLYRLHNEELQHRVVQRLLLRKFPAHDIARTLDLSLRHTYRLIDKLKTKTKSETALPSTGEIIQRYLWDYDQFIADLLNLAEQEPRPERIRAKLQAMKQIISIDNNRILLLKLSGFFKEYKWTVKKPFKKNALYEESEAQNILDFTFAYVRENHGISFLDIMKEYRTHEKRQQKEEAEALKKTANSESAAKRAADI